MKVSPIQMNSRLIVDPWGHVIAKASDGIGSVTARIHPERVAKVRQGMPVALHKVLEV
jgi:nitrilase